jgi:hypothetical protein
VHAAVSALLLLAGKGSQPAAAAASSANTASKAGNSISLNLQRGLTEVASLYKGVVSAATGAGIIIGAYFAFYSTSKRFLKEHTEWKEGEGCQPLVLCMVRMMMSAVTVLSSRQCAAVVLGCAWVVPVHQMVVC